MKTSTAVEAFLAECRSRRLSHRTLTVYRWALAFLPEQLPDAPSPVRELLVTPKLSAVSAADVLRVLRTFYRWAADELDVPDATRKVKAPKVDRFRPRTFRLDELHGLLEAANDEIEYALVTVLMETGIRIGEAWSMTYDRIRGDEMTVDGKTGERDVPLSQAVRSALVGVGGPKWVWVGRRGRLSVSGLQQMFGRLCGRAGISGAKASPHTMRHTFVTEQLRAGRPLPIVQMLAGHTQIATTMRYAHLITTDMTNGHEDYSLVRRYKLGG
jgi:integrase/recombinase XerD